MIWWGCCSGGGNVTWWRRFVWCWQWFGWGLIWSKANAVIRNVIMDLLSWWLHDDDDCDFDRRWFNVSCKYKDRCGWSWCFDGNGYFILMDDLMVEMGLIVAVVLVWMMMAVKMLLSYFLVAVVFRAIQLFSHLRSDNVQCALHSNKEESQAPFRRCVPRKLTNQYTKDGHSHRNPSPSVRALTWMRFYLLFPSFMPTIYVTIVGLLVVRLVALVMLMLMNLWWVVIVVLIDD